MKCVKTATKYIIFITAGRAGEFPLENIPILLKAFLTFASKNSVGPSHRANGQCAPHPLEFGVCSVYIGPTDTTVSPNLNEKNPNVQILKGPPPYGRGLIISKGLFACGSIYVLTLSRNYTSASFWQRIPPTAPLDI